MRIFYIFYIIHPLKILTLASFLLFSGLFCIPIEYQPNIDTFQNPTIPHEVLVDNQIRFQSIVGFGAAMTGSSAWLLMKKMTPNQRTAILEQLFGTSGASFSSLRIPMGSSDFSLEAHSFDDLDIDRAYIIPALLETLKINPKLSMIASPWSAPAGMKTSNSLRGGLLIDSAEIYKAYAVYFRDFVQSYQALGIPIFAVTIQNEPENNTPNMPSMGLTAQQEQKLAILIGQEFKQAGLQTRIITWDHNWNNTIFPSEILSDPSAGDYIDGTAFHCYAGDVSSQSKLQQAFPTKNIYFTECSSGDWGSGFSADLMWDAKNLIVGATRNWARTILKWNLVLDSKHGPILPGGCHNCRGVVTIEDTGETILNEDYYALAHLSQFVQPGAWRIGSSHPNSVAFENPNQDIILVLYNPDSREPHTYHITWKNLSFDFTLSASSIATLVWSKLNSSVQCWLTSGDQKNLLTKQADLFFR